MNGGALSQSEMSPKATSFTTTLVSLGFLMGVAMPIISALLFPTYTHVMNTPKMEWLRLIEAPFAFCEAIIVAWAMYRGMEPLQLVKAAPIDVKVALLLLIAGLFISSASLSQRPADSLTISFIYLIHLLFFAAVVHLMTATEAHDHRTFVLCLGAGLPILAIWTVCRFAFPPDPSAVMGGTIVWKAATPGFINVRYFGSWTGAVSAAFLVTLLNNKEHRALTWAHVFYFTAMAMTIWSGTRAAIIALGLAAVIIAVMSRKLPTVRALSIVAMLTGAAAISAWLLIPHDDSAFQMFARTGVGSPEHIDSGRTALWKATFDRWQDSPWFGWGSGSTFWEVFVDWTHTQPHNVFLQFLISWGVVGTIGALWLLARAIWAVHRKVLRQPELQPMLAILYSLLIMSLVAGMLHYTRFVMLVTALFAIIIAYRAPKTGTSALA
jgi:exopolysaccharide production protein ExoQ